jgi:hypothetical protein
MGYREMSRRPSRMLIAICRTRRKNPPISVVKSVRHGAVRSNDKAAVAEAYREFLASQS